MRTDFVTTTQPPGGDPFEEGGSQAVKVQLKLREMVLAGELKAGARITELALVEKLGVSRTPIRAALIRLARGLAAANAQRWFCCTQIFRS